ncbi:MAG TPA: glycosyltransferase family 39 protein [Terriglobales bacterium]|nr:glycosyltransferase family 39 protein [Terriglobales bacterium]
MDLTAAPQLSNCSTRPAGGRKSSLVAILVLAALWAAIYVAGMFTPALLDDADTVHAEAAREMLLRHDWVTLHANGVRYLEKAPLMYWGVATSYVLFGVSEWSTRLPLMLGLLALFLATYALGRRAYGEEGGFYAGVVLTTALGPYLFTRFLIPDTLVGLWLAAAFYFFLQSLDQEKPTRLVCWGMAAACALNVLTKGLIGLVFPGAVIGLYLILTGNLRHLLRLRLISSTVIFLAIAAPWHVLAALRNPAQGAVRGFLWFYFVNEHFLRYLNERMPRDYDTVPLLLFWALLLLWLLPWVAFLPQALKDVPMRWRQWRAGLDGRQRANLLFFLWALVILVFFSFSTRQEYYTIPALPGLALLVGGWLGREADARPGSKERRAGRISSLVLLVASAAALCVGLYFWSLAKTPAPGTDLADLLKRNPQDYALSFGHFLDLTPQALGAFRAPLLGFVLAFFLGALLNGVFRRRGHPGPGNAALALMMVALFACVHSAFVTFSPILSSKKLALATASRYQPGDTVVVDGKYENASTLNFYTGIHLRSLHAPAGNMWYGTQFPDSPPVWESEASFQALWAEPARVFLWTDKESPKAVEGMPHYVLAREGGKSILTNHPLVR